MAKDVAARYIRKGLEYIAEELEMPFSSVFLGWYAMRNTDTFKFEDLVASYLEEKREPLRLKDLLVLLREAVAFECAALYFLIRGRDAESEMLKEKQLQIDKYFCRQDIVNEILEIVADYSEKIRR